MQGVHSNAKPCLWDTSRGSTCHRGCLGCPVVERLTRVREMRRSVPGRVIPYLLTYLCPSLLVEHRPSTTPHHRTVFWAALAIPDQLVRKSLRWRPFLAQVNALVCCCRCFCNWSFFFVQVVSLALRKPLYLPGELVLP